MTPAAARALLPPRKEDSHKGTFGHLLVLAGALGYAGAAKLACRAAERSGVGLVTLGLPDPLLLALSMALTETMTLPFPATPEGAFAAEAADPALTAAATRQAVALGPGLGQQDGTGRFVRAFVSACPVPLVLDADGLNLLAGDMTGLGLRTAETVLSPHPGEMARLCGVDTATVQADRMGLALEHAKAWNAVVILKGSGTLVAAPDGQCVMNTSGNHGMAKGGTGDVLTGLIGGLLAQGMPAFDAACLAVFVHGRAGDIALGNLGARGMVAGDLITALPVAWQQLERGE